MTTPFLHLVRHLRTLRSGCCCDLKLETPAHRIWHCRVSGEVTLETLVNGRWVVECGSCTEGGGS